MTNVEKTHCPKGHPYTPENTYIDPSGWRRCRECIGKPNPGRPRPRQDARLQALLDLLLQPARAGWAETGLCSSDDVNPERFFPSVGENTKAARALCNACPVQAQCLGAGLGEIWGIWGGASWHERRKLRQLIPKQSWPTGSIGHRARSALMTEPEDEQVA